ncbi:lipocalin family protein [Flavobacterium hercynium]|uniref:Uncharacterized protein n=1 Tax=Flavobacterium hercynium TaxID=387094 RepID=A0A226HGC3_9FLAO|nr:lipocalin family protein [Flavobacterium hercynium]OXA93154.1 hypothetical protein B0A66_07720 [Flavobacterium hercynium]SMP32780.1 Lipocalin-like domain-containing protein [Flavobacterium hercynium]
MKNRKIFYVLALSFGLFAASCSNDDNEGETIIPLEGKYNLSQIGAVVNGQEVLTDAPQNTSGCDRDYLQLKIDNTLIVGDYDSTVSACALTETGGIYSRSHNDLTTVVNNITQTQDIMNLTNKELKLKDKTTGVITVYTR